MLMLFPLMTLMTDAARVIEMRLRMMVRGESKPDEMLLMISEKVNAFHEAGAILVRTGDPSHVINNYQRIVAANIARLSGT